MVVILSDSVLQGIYILRIYISPLSDGPVDCLSDCQKGLSDSYKANLRKWGVVRLSDELSDGTGKRLSDCCQMTVR